MIVLSALRRAIPVASAAIVFAVAFVALNVGAVLVQRAFAPTRVLNVGVWVSAPPGGAPSGLPLLINAVTCIVALALAGAVALVLRRWLATLLVPPAEGELWPY